jgi:hypothetical protein
VPGEWFEWKWDETLFAGAARDYDLGRLPNAPGLGEAFEQALGLDARRRLLDVGCGPGTVTFRSPASSRRSSDSTPMQE